VHNYYTPKIDRAASEQEGLQANPRYSSVRNTYTRAQVEEWGLDVLYNKCSKQLTFELETGWKLVGISRRHKKSPSEEGLSAETPMD